MNNVIAIDGPAGAGKSTLSKLLAEKLNFIYLDTGAMYRSITYLALKQGINLDDKKKLGELAERTEFEFRSSTANINSRVIVNDTDLTDFLRTNQIDKNVSTIAKIENVRSALLKKQRDIAKKGNIIMDGRDIGSRVLPNADLKFYVTASLDERARRRYLELKKKGNNFSFEDVKKKISKRDQLDMNRKISPLHQAKDAILIDTTDLTIKEALIKMIKIVKDEEDVKTII